MVISRETILGYYHPETDELFCSRCAERIDDLYVLPDLMLTEENAEDGNFYFCDECGRLFLET